MRRSLRWMVLGLLLAAAAAWWWRPRPAVMTLTGTVDGNEIVVGSQITARIARLAVDDGQSVKAGDLIATLDRGVQAADVQAAQDAIRQAQASARQSEAQTALLAASLPAKLAQTEAQQQQAQAQVNQAQAQQQSAQAAWQRAQAAFQRIQPLTKQGVMSPQDLDNATADLDAAQAGRVAAQAAVLAAQRAQKAATAAVSDAQAQQHQLAVQRQQTAALEAAARGAQAALEAAQTRLGYTKIVAPVDGIITLRAARQGEVVNPGSPIVTIFQTSDTWVDADVEETYAAETKLGQLLEMRLPSGRTLRGPVIYKAVEADFATQRDVSRTKRDIKTVRIRVRVPNPGGELPLGMTAWVLLPTGGAS
ncbi:MAG TPA: efflux RND transporter periplasmic adaptor subunit [Terriglobales bacterium]|nr:efflux RND transporter periplasmic adaptor subunit [Terriglobales bacterium]